MNDSNKNKRIMIVEDENIIALDLKLRLSNLGYNVAAVVHTGEDAIKNAAILNPDLILMDVVLRGDMDGVQAAEKIKSIKDTPIIFITAYSDENTLQRAQRLSPFGYLIKPFNERELNYKIGEVFSGKMSSDRNFHSSNNYSYSSN